MHVLVTAASRHGSTAQIADAIGEGLRSNGHSAEARKIESISGLGAYDAVILGSAVYEGRWLTSARTFANRFATELAALPVWIFSSGMTGIAGPGRDDNPPRDATRIAAATGARQVAVFGGKLDAARLGPLERLMIRAVHAEHGDFRDWDAIDAYAVAIAGELVYGRPGTVTRG